MKENVQKNKPLNEISFRLKKMSLKISICAILLLIPFQIIPHGTVTYPPSRVWVCFNELTTGVSNETTSPACQAAVIGWGTQAFYDWSEVARMDAADDHLSIIFDGNLASAGRPDKFGGIDQVRDDWVATPVTPGPFTVTWSLSAPHQTLYYRVYITKADWTPDQPLTWDSLELLVETEPSPAAATDNIDVVLPQRTGKHVIYSVWQRSLTDEAFYSTSDVDFGASTEPVAPVADFTIDNGTCGGPEVVFNAESSYDANGDELTYTWDFGDGNTAEGVEVTHTFADGLDSSLVSLTVSDGDFSSGDTQTVNNLVLDEECNESTICAFDTPSENPLPSVNETYNFAYVIGDDGPDFSNIYKFFINWDSGNNGLYNFDYQTLSTYTSLRNSITHNFGSASPSFTVAGSGIENFDDSYYVTLDEGNLVFVSQTRDLTLYFSTTATDPDCEEETDTSDDVAGGSITGGPFQFTIDDGTADNVSNITLVGENGDNSQWVISDEAGVILGLPAAPEDFNFDVVGEGRSFIHHLSYNDPIENLAVGNNIMNLVGEYDFSNSIDVTTTTDVIIPIDFENVVYEEEVDGDLSTDNDVPTIIELVPGDNRVISSQAQIVDQANFFTFQIPEGYELSQLIVDSFEGTDDIGFIGIDEGSIITGQPANNAPARLIGGLSYGTTHVGTNILPAMGDLSNPAAAFVSGFGFTPPLATGEYAVWLNQTGIMSETVLNFVITEIDTEEETETSDCNFDTDSALSTLFASYDYAHVIGTNGPDLSSVTKFTINWDLNNNGLYQFAFNLNESPWYSNFSNNTQSFSQSDPSISLTGTSIDSLDGVYAVASDNGNLVLVADNYSIYFSNSATAPDCDVEEEEETEEEETEEETSETTNCTFDTPSDTAMPALYYRSYNREFNGSITVIGENGPDLSSWRKLDLDYANGVINRLYYEEWFDLGNAKIELAPDHTEHTFDQVNPELTLSNTGIDNLDGSYYVTIKENEAGANFQDFIMVSKTGDFTIYFSYSEEPSECDETIAAKEISDTLLFLTMFPNPTTNNVSLSAEKDLKGSIIKISDLMGKQVRSLLVSDNTSNVSIDLSDIKPGLYLVTVLQNSGSSRILKLLVK